MLKSNLCNYSDAYTLAKEFQTLLKAVTTSKNANKKVVFKNCSQFSICISKINNIEIDNSKYIDVEMSMYNLIEYNNIYSKTSRGLWLI